MKKFLKNDIFYNNVLATPKYNIVLQSGSLRINDQINQNSEKSSSLNLIDYGGVYNIYQLSNVKYSGSYQYTSSISRSFIYATSSNGSTYPNYPTFHEYYTNYIDVLKIQSLQAIFKEYESENEYANLKYYLKKNTNGFYVPELKKQKGASPLLYPPYYVIPTCSINLIEIPRTFYGSYIQPGSIQLNMYVSGVLTASARDSDKTGKLFQTLGPTTGNVVGSVLYDHGIVLLTSSQNLSNQLSPYIQPLAQYTSSTDSLFNQINPINDYLKWIYFGSYKSTEGAAPETKYELIFKGTNYIPTLTLFCNAEKNELMWSNNRTFIQSGQGNKIYVGQTTSSTDITGAVYYAPSGSILIHADGTLRENKDILIKNTISSSFVNYSASYEPQVFISRIGIYDEQKNLIAYAKLANPVRKTKELDYTFKLKLDF